VRRQFRAETQKTLAKSHITALLRDLAPILVDLRRQAREQWDAIISMCIILWITCEEDMEMPGSRSEVDAIPDRGCRRCGLWRLSHFHRKFLVASL
jgi:hypothetical protein